MKKSLNYVITVLFTVFCLGSTAQEVSKMTLTDHFAGSSKVTMGKPKPGPAKSTYQLLNDEKGTQVMIFVDLIPNESAQDPCVLKFTAYKIVQGKSEYVDDRELPLKSKATYALSAFNFFEEGNYKIVVTDQSGKKNLAEQSFSITR